MRRFVGLEKSSLRIIHNTTISKHGKDEGDGESSIVKTKINKAEIRGISLPSTYHIFRYAVEVCSKATAVIKKYTNIFYLRSDEKQPTQDLRNLTKAQLESATKGTVEEDQTQYETLPLSLDHDDYTYSGVPGINKLHQVVGLFPPDFAETKGMGSRTQILGRRYSCVSCKGCLEPINRHSSDDCEYLEQLPKFRLITMERGRFIKGYVAENSDEEEENEELEEGEEEEQVVVRVQGGAGEECDDDENVNSILISISELDMT
jgi:hypothetical protein